MREMRETLRASFGRMFRLENRRSAVRRGTLERISALDRMITIYLPPGYERSDARYPVLYMQDGQNLFEPERAFIPGQPWRLDEAADQAIAERTVQPLIIAGVDHAGAGRIDEYTPTRDGTRKAGGKADGYVRMLLQELKPLIDARYRTLPADNAIGGSSLGGLLSLYAGLKYAEIFSKVAAMSPSVWWNGRALLEIVDRFAGPRPRLWLDVGGREGADTVRDTRILRDRLLRRGWSDDFHYLEDRRGEHSERSWARRARPMLEFLFVPRPSS